MTALSVQEQLARGGIGTVQTAAIALAELVAKRQRISRKDAINTLTMEQDFSKRNVERAMVQAKTRGWVAFTKVEGAPGGAVDLIPGEVTDF